jgi:hypothetical protein
MCDLENPALDLQMLSVYTSDIKALPMLRLSAAAIQVQAPDNGAGGWAMD